MAPSQIVPAMADKGEYIASESTIYRILREMNQLRHRGRSKTSVRKIATTHIAAAPNKVWSWDITWLPGMILGMHFKLYLVLDIYSRKIVGWESSFSDKYCEYVFTILADIESIETLIKSLAMYTPTTNT